MSFNTPSSPPPVTDIEELLLTLLCDPQLPLPISSTKIHEQLEQTHQLDKKPQEIRDLLVAFSGQKLLTLSETPSEDDKLLPVTISGVDIELINSSKSDTFPSLKRKLDPDNRGSGDESAKKVAPNDIMSLLAMPSTLEKQNKEVGVEILELLSKPTAKERSLAEKFKSAGGTQVHKFCPHGTRRGWFNISTQYRRMSWFNNIFLFF